MKPHPSFSALAAFSLLEVLATVTILGTLAAVAFQHASGIDERVRRTRLESDVQTLNSALRVYLASGGSVTDADDADAVIRKLQTIRSRDSAVHYVGFRGSMLDTRMNPVFQGADEAATAKPRVMWDSEAGRFFVATEGEGGISRFAWGAPSGAIQPREEARDAGPVSYNGRNGWIWAYDEAGGPPLAAPTIIPTNPASPQSPAGPPREEVRLAPPQFLTPPGTFAYADFPASVVLSNPNPSGSSVVYYATEWDTAGIRWTVYTEPVAVAPGTQVLTYAAGSGGGFLDSHAIGGVYIRSDFQLQAPEIEASAPFLDLQSNESITIELIDRNPGFAVHRLEYAINGGDFQTYEGPVEVRPGAHAGGFSVVARSTPGGEGFVPSPETGRVMDLKLRVPGIEVGDAFEGPEGALVPIQLSNPNPEGSSTLLYALRNEETGGLTPFRPYEAPFTIAEEDYPRGVTVVAYAEPARPHYLASDEASTFVLTFFGIPVTGSTLFVLDTSGSMAWDDGIGQVKREMHRVLDLMEPEHRFGIVRFSTDAEVVQGWGLATPQRLEVARNRVDRLSAGGWTNYSEALNLALGGVRNYGVEQVVFLSDGEPTAGDTRPEALLAQVAVIVAEGARVDTLAFGRITEEGRELLERMDEAGTPARSE